MANDLSKACWRCTYWAGFAHPQANHSLCSRLNSFAGAGFAGDRLCLVDARAG